MGLPRNRRSMLVFKWLLSTSKHCPWASMLLPMKQQGLFWTSPGQNSRTFCSKQWRGFRKWEKEDHAKSCWTRVGQGKQHEICWTSAEWAQGSATPRYNSPARVPALQRWRCHLLLRRLWCMLQRNVVWRATWDERNWQCSTPSAHVLMGLLSAGMFAFLKY